MSEKEHRSPSTLITAAVTAVAVLVVGVAMYFVGEHSVKKTTGQTATTAQTQTVKKVGILQTMSHPALDQIHQGVIDGLKKGGYVEGKNLEVTSMNGEGDQSKLATMSQQLVNKKLDALCGIATGATQALANTTKDIPIMLGAVTDPVAAGVVKDLKHPGGNITGVSNVPPLKAQLELARKLLPKAKSVGFLYNSDEVNAKSQVEHADAIAKKMGLETKRFAVPTSNEIAQTVQIMSDQVDFIFIPNDNAIANAMPTVTQEANKKHEPVIVAADTMVKQGALATIAPSQYDFGLKTGEMMADVLSGKSKTATTPVYVFNGGDVYINKKEADLNGITVPDSVMKNAKVVGEEGSNK